jgi:hypothetical protein
MINLAQPASFIRTLALPHTITAEEMPLIRRRIQEIWEDNIYMPYNDAVRLAIDEILCTMEA